LEGAAFTSDGYNVWMNGGKKGDSLSNEEWELHLATQRWFR